MIISVQVNLETNSDALEFSFIKKKAFVFEIIFLFFVTFIGSSKFCTNFYYMTIDLVFLSVGRRCACGR